MNTRWASSTMVGCAPRTPRALGPLRSAPRASKRSHVGVLVLAGAIVGLVAGCDDAPKPTGAKPAASAEKESAVDAKVAKAAAAVAAGSAKAASTAGPPETGVFPPGAADAAVPKTGAVKIEMGSDGAEPRVTLKPSAAAWKGSATVGVSIRLGQRNAMPAADLVLSLSTEKAKDAKDAKDDKAAAPVALLAEVKKSPLSQVQLGTVPAEVGKEIGKIKGSTMSFGVGETGTAISPTNKLAKDATPDLGRILDGGSDAVFFASVPPPPKPVGVGGFWIAGSRQMISGADVVSYRLFKVKAIDGDKVTLTLEAHQYLANPNVTLPGAPREPVSQFESTAQGELVVKLGEPLAQTAELQHGMTMVFGAVEAAPGQQAGRKAIQLISQTKLAREGK